MTTESKYLFISYSRKDAKAVNKVIYILTEAGYSVWIDKTGIESGDQFKHVIVNAIEGCEAVLYFASKNSNNSTWTSKEIGIATSLKKKIIPIKLDHSAFNKEVLFDIVNLNYIDLTKPKESKENIELLLSTLNRIIDGNAKPNAVPVKIPPKKPSKLWLSLGTFACLALLAIASLPLSPHLQTLLNRNPSNGIREVVNHAERGQIFDCKDRVIARNKTVYDVHMDCCTIEDAKEWKRKSRKLAQEIAEILPERTAREWWSYFHNARQFRKRFLPIAQNVDGSLLDTLKTLTLFNEGQFKGGIICSSKQIREYPYGNLARRTIGVWNSGLQDYAFGLEHQYDAELKGKDGITSVKKGRHSHKETNLIDKIDGWDIYTTLDMEYQAIADSILCSTLKGDQSITGGCLILMDTFSGAVLALANCHRLDNGAIGEYFNYALNYSYEPGKVAQTMTLAAALSDGIVKTLNDSIAMKPDSIALRYADSQEYFSDWFKTFCIDNNDFDISDMKCLDIQMHEGQENNDLISIGSGLGFTVCPMHIITFYNTIANDGIMMKPMLIRKQDNEEFGSRQVYSSELQKVLHKEVTDTLKKALIKSFNEDIGCMFNKKSRQFAGKTGMSCQVIDPKLRGESEDPYQDVNGKRNYAFTFAGFYPAESPQYSVLCALFTNPTECLPDGTRYASAASIQLVESIAKNY